ncbi:MAG: 2-amino-4-hydroxy-6-hydroxymethyldihydropteridine diphosphokinase [Symploca sp. SIO1C4]|uniref:2-amino-4-hydroxy-6-hydroxymethyldihydropteridine diphosphokinase n=1 Tax=Symploca sp. SIO1C4 TaxID=2607765 RepID=A0A6B3NMJ8_9CYAN|nr:2-amino-4-hydroxy-6-hydroxymethyldihydropteridine diphosphokinase [Symploca sp. SIO1C4]
MYKSETFTTTKPALSAIALGSNLGDSRAILEAALDKINKTPNFTIKACSSWYKTAPIGPAQPDFLNGCAILEVTLSPHKLLETLLGIEQDFGRVRLEHWGPRTLDLDIILFDNLILETPDLQIPHRLMRDRAFVLVPLAEIAPDWIEPVSGLTVSQLVQRLDCSEVRLIV